MSGKSTELEVKMPYKKIKGLDNREKYTKRAFFRKNKKRNN